MPKSLLLIIICGVASPALCEPSVKYEVATILDVQQHQSAGESSSTAAASYDVFVKVLGRSQEVPIVSQRLATAR